MRTKNVGMILGLAVLTASAALFAAPPVMAARPTARAVRTTPHVFSDPPPIFVGGRVVHEPAFMQGSHVLVPVRGVFEALHAVVFYTPPRIVVVRKDGAVIAGLVVDRQTAVVNNIPRTLSVAPERHGGRIYVPLRAIAEIAGAQVAYSTHPRLIDIRLPSGELMAPQAVVPEAAPPPPSGPPIWAFGIVGTVLFALAFECLRRLMLVSAAKRTPRAALISSPRVRPGRDRARRPRRQPSRRPPDC